MPMFGKFMIYLFYLDAGSCEIKIGIHVNPESYLKSMISNKRGLMDQIRLGKWKDFNGLRLNFKSNCKEQTVYFHAQGYIKMKCLLF